MVQGAVAAGVAAPERFTVVRSGIDVDAYADFAARREEPADASVTGRTTWS